MIDGVAGLLSSDDDVSGSGPGLRRTNLPRVSDSSESSSFSSA